MERRLRGNPQHSDITRGSETESDWLLTQRPEKRQLLSRFGGFDVRHCVDVLSAARQGVEKEHWIDCMCGRQCRNANTQYGVCRMLKIVRWS